MDSNRRQRGVTLTELMVVVGILAVLGAMAFPMITQTIPNYQLRAAAREMVVNFKKAKVEAVRRNQTVLLEFTLETIGNPDAGGSYRLCLDTNNDGVCDETLQQVNLPHGIRLVDASFGVTGNRAGFTSRGLPWANSFGNVTLQTADGGRELRVSLAAGGRVRVE